MTKKPQINLRALRQQRGWTQNETAKALGFCRSYIADVENRRGSISVGMMNAIITAFGVKYEDFYRGDDTAGRGASQ